MADVDEDWIVSTATDGEGPSSGDDEDEPILDFSALSLSAQTSLPKRGTKDFEPNPTMLQRTTLASSRAAMHDALSHTRTHNPRNRVVGVYQPSTGLTRVSKIRGTLFRTVGRDASGGGVDLVAEEALWALESGRLDVRWPCQSSALNGEGGQVQECDLESGLPMSLQAAYVTYLDDDWLTLEKYLVYTGLKRAGYIVTRATNSPQQSETAYTFPPRRDARAGAPLVAPGLYRSWNDIYALLRLIPSTSQSVSFAPPSGTTSRIRSTRSDELEKVNSGNKEAAAAAAAAATAAGKVVSVAMVDENETRAEMPQQQLTTTYNIYKPNPSYRKSAPGMASFRVCVLSTRDTPFVPKLEELSSLLNEQPAPVSSSFYPSSSSSPASSTRLSGGALASASAPLSSSTARNQYGSSSSGDGSDVRGDGDGGGIRGDGNGRGIDGVRGDSNSRDRGRGTNGVRGDSNANGRGNVNVNANANGSGTGRGRGGINQVYNHIKTAGRNVLLAVVQDGVVSYLRIGEAAFEDKSLFQAFDEASTLPFRGGGGKGRGRGGGRGGGRGRGGRGGRGAGASRVT